MCMYCEKGKSMCNSNIKDLGIELHSGTSKLVAYGLDEFGWDISVSCDINYCPMCRKEAGRVIENYREIKFTEYVKHKGEPDWEIAWNKRMLELIDKDPTGGAKEKRLKNIRRWEEVKEKNAKRSD